MSKDGIAEVRLTRNALGDVTDEQFFSCAGEPAKNGECVHHVVHALNAQGLAVADRYVDASGHAIARSDGVYEIRRVFDDVGNVLEGSYWGLDGRAVRSKEDDAVTYRIARDEHGAEVLRTYLSEKGWPTMSAHGFVSQQTIRDATGLPIERRAIGANGKPTWHQGRVYAAWRRKLDERGRTVSESYFGLEGRPATLADGYQTIEMLHDERDHIIVYEYKDDHGNLVPTEHGFAIERLEYDIDRLVRSRYFDAHDKPVNPTYKYPDREIFYERRLAYDELGDISEEKLSGVGAPETEPVPTVTEHCDSDAGKLVVDAATKNLITELGRLRDATKS